MDQLLISPDGVLTNVSADKVDAAIKDGGFTSLPTDTSNLAISPAGIVTQLDSNTKNDALDPSKGGFKPIDLIVKHHQSVQKDYEEIKKIPELFPHDYTKELQSTHSSDQLLDPDHNIILKDSNGNIINKPLNQAVDLISSGQAELNDPNAQSAMDAYLQKYGEQNGPVSAGILSAAQNFVPGLKAASNYVQTHSGNNLNVIQHMAEQIDINKHSTAKTIGAVAGSIAGIIATGGAGLLGEGALAAKAAAGIKVALTTAESGALARIGATVAGEAAGGAILSTPQALGQYALDQDPKATAETLALGTLAGGGLGLIMQGATEALPAIKNAFNDVRQGITEAGGTRLSDQLLEGQLGMTGKERSLLGTPAQQSEKLQTLIDHIGPEAMGKMTKTELAQSILDLAEDTGPKVGGIMKKLDAAVAEKAPSMIEEIKGPSVFEQQTQLQKLAEGLEGPLRAQEKKVVENSIEQLNTIAKDRSTLTFQEQQDFKKVLQGEANYRTDASSNLNNLRKQIADIPKVELEKAADRVATTIGNPSLIDEWSKYKQLYGLASQLEKPALRVINAPISTSLIGHGGLIGSLIGHGLGIPVVGPLIGALGSKLVSHWVRDTGLTKLSLFLRKNAQSPNIGTYVALDANAVLQNKLREIPELLRATVNKTVGNLDNIKSALGDETNGLSKTQQFNKLSDQISGMISNPEILTQQVKHMTAPIAVYHPELADQMEKSIIDKISFLHQNLPKQMHGPLPFTKNEKFVPSAQQLSDFNQILGVAENPFSVIDKMKNGSLTAKEVGALSVMNPAILARIREEITKEAYTSKTNLNYQQKLAASLLMGQDMSSSLSSVHQLQSVYGPNVQASSPVPQPKRSRGGSKGLKDVDKIPGAQPTLAQRLLK